MQDHAAITIWPLWKIWLVLVDYRGTCSFSPNLKHKHAMVLCFPGKKGGKEKDVLLNIDNKEKNMWGSFYKVLCVWNPLVVFLVFCSYILICIMIWYGKVGMGHSKLGLYNTTYYVSSLKLILQLICSCFSLIGLGIEQDFVLLRSYACCFLIFMHGYFFLPGKMNLRFPQMEEMRKWPLTASMLPEDCLTLDFHQVCSIRLQWSQPLCFLLNHLISGSIVFGPQLMKVIANTKDYLAATLLVSL